MPANDVATKAEIEYRAVSLLALATLFLGVASALAFTHPIFIAVPVIALAIGTAALVRIAASEGALFGRKAAIVGLCLAVLFGFTAASRVLSRDIWLKHRASVLTDHYMELLRTGKGREAQQLQMAEEVRLDPAEDLEAYFERNPGLQQAYSEFCDQDGVQALLDSKGKAQVTRIEASMEAGSTKNVDHVRVTYLVLFPSGLDKNPSNDVQMTLDVFAERTYVPASDREEWRIRGMRASKSR
ncbi:MAG: hypothetical protein SGJ20_20290 [Planctomycetota bacterium]|nr:hypothetical protein [Planctomycetota bacterium]